MFGVMQDSAVEDGKVLALILDQTPFYAEQGGQIGDEGYLEIGGNRFLVRDTQKSGSYILHVGSWFGPETLAVRSRVSDAGRIN